MPEPAVYLLRVTVEAKDEWGGGAGVLPVPRELASRTSDILRDQTRGDWETAWMIRDVEVVAEPQA